jgi:glucosyl-dolichyl phosphate glucuronosyltransferase
MKITVILCTYNRCESLATAMESIAASVLSASVEWDVLVVDNNSNDRTPAVVEDFSRRLPRRFSYLLERQRGKSFALNSGIRVARGDVLAFVDDDVTVEPAWLCNLTSALNDPDCAGAGGRIVLQWPSALPNWLSTAGPLERHGFPGFDKGPEAKDLVGPPFGTNMAFRKIMFEKYGGFRADLGPNPSSEIRGEDTEFGRRLIAAGERLRYEPSAVVFHPVSASKLNKPHILRWWFDNGRASAREFSIPPLRELFSLAAWSLRWIMALQPQKRFYCRVAVWEKSGRLVEWSRRSRDAKGLPQLHGQRAE